MTPRVVEFITCTISANTSEYVFEIALSDLGMDRLRQTTFLGMSFKKPKYQFLNDLAEALTQEILEKLEQLGED